MATVGVLLSAWSVGRCLPCHGLSFSQCLECVSLLGVWIILLAWTVASWRVFIDLDCVLLCGSFLLTWTVYHYLKCGPFLLTWTEGRYLECGSFLLTWTVGRYRPFLRLGLWVANWSVVHYRHSGSLPGVWVFTDVDSRWLPGMRVIFTVVVYGSLPGVWVFTARTVGRYPECGSLLNWTVSRYLENGSLLTWTVGSYSECRSLLISTVGRYLECG